jgi:radical SAM protein (TIGR01212 family)
MTHTWGHDKPYNDYTGYIKHIFSQRVQKISINAGFTCPNRDGTISTGGCTYCNNQTFNPFYCKPDKSISQQLTEGISFFAPKYKSQKYFAYFQAYSNTYSDINVLKALYSEALSIPDIIGLVIATRPDCIDDTKLDYIKELSLLYYVMVEYGIESCNNATLRFINRGHSFEDSVKAIRMTAGRGIKTGLHLILGLPLETYNSIIKQADIISKLPIHTLKLHQLQIIQGTRLADQIRQNPELVINYSVNEYIDLVIDFLERLNPAIIIERITSESPQHLLISPNWGGLKNFEIIAMLIKRMNERNTWQGRLYG